MAAAAGSNVTMDSGLDRRIWTGRLPGQHNPLRRDRHNNRQRAPRSNRQRAPYSNRRIDHRLMLVTIHVNGKTAARGQGNKRSGHSWSGITVRASMAHSARRILQVSSEADRADSGGAEASAARSLVRVQRWQRLRRLLQSSLQIALACRFQVSSDASEVAGPLGITVEAGTDGIYGRRKRLVAVS